MIAIVILNNIIFSYYIYMPRSKNRWSSKAHREARQNKSRHHVTKKRKLKPIQGSSALDADIKVDQV